ncbi:MAG: PAS domain-containing protein [Bdellovibrionales bacterium]|nr:PAS domain-containing protein [Bdellovibrionales bacterium]
MYRDNRLVPLFFLILGLNVLLMAGSNTINHLDNQIVHSVKAQLETINQGQNPTISESLKTEQARLQALAWWESAIGFLTIILSAALIVAGYLLILKLKFQKQTVERAIWDAKRFRRALDIAADIAVTDTFGRLKEVNSTFEQVSGYTSAEVLGKNHRIINSGTHPASFWHTFWTTIKSGQVFRGEICNKRKDGTLYWVDASVVPQRDSLGNIVEFITIRQDITARKQIEQQIAQQRATQEAISRVQDLLLSGSPPRQVCELLLKNLLETTGSTYGYIGEIHGVETGAPFLKTHAITDISWNDEVKRRFDVMSAGTGFEFTNLQTLYGHVLTENQVVIANDPSHDPRSGGLPPGHPPLTAYLGIPVRFGDTLIGSIGLANRPQGYSEAMLAELTPYIEATALILHAIRDRRELKTAHDSMEQAQLSARLGTWTLDVKTQQARWSRQMFEIWDFPPHPDGLAPSFEEMRTHIHPDDRPIYDRSLSEITGPGKSQYVEFRVVRRDESITYVLGIGSVVAGRDGRILSAYGTCQDISEVRQVQAQLDTERSRLMQASKMATLGEMASGVAHEINNPLAIIRGFADQLIALAGKDQLNPAKVSESADKIGSQVMRIKKIVDGLRTFARDGEKDRLQETPVQRIVDETLELCRARFNNNRVELRLNLPAHLPTIKCREVQVSQILINLLSNSFDAINEFGPAERWIELSCLEIGNQVEFRVRDSGPGVAVHNRYLIFQPFFTTKEIGKGTGLGLSISKGIAESHHGSLYYDGTAGQMAFVLALPKDPALATPSQAEPVKPAA